jgi:hypothetical protein
MNLRKQVFLGGIAANCKRDAAQAGNFEEGSPIHIKNDLLGTELLRYARYR